MKIVIESHFRIILEEEQERINTELENILRRHSIRVRNIVWKNGKS